MESPATDNSNDLIEQQLDVRVEDLETETKSDVLAIVSPLVHAVDDMIQELLEWKKDKGKTLSVMLETPGGYSTVVERIVHTMRQHYKRVEFIIPNYAMSAGTVLVMSGDVIHMNYYSQLGPIDPQLQRDDGRLTPALGYLVQYKRLVEKSREGTLTAAELAFLVQRFDPADLYAYEQDKDLGIALVAEWLVKYKFRRWKKTKTHKRHVTAKIRKERATKIAELLSKPEEWHSHGRRISMDVLRRRLKLQIENFGVKPRLNNRVMTYYRLLKDYMMRRDHPAALHVRSRYNGIIKRS